ncbi:MAG TPA: deoxyribonuclease V [Blastocatellia bacterium]|nr:deoxyribonuclease V [Blastocatellia bacterium]
MPSNNQIHSWDVTPTEAVQVQRELRERVVLQPLPENINLVAGADISFNKFSETIYAGIVVLKLATLEVVATAGKVTTTKFPYVPGLLSFREAPALLEAWELLKVQPDVLVLDGQGIAHPRRVGIASHVGILLNLPTVGCAKNVLVGKFVEPDTTAGSYSPMIDRGETVGAALRTKNRVNPVFVSPGHLADIPSAVDLMLKCVRGFGTAKGSKYRIPEPTRMAHLFVNALRRGEEWVPQKA